MVGDKTPTKTKINTLRSIPFSNHLKFFFPRLLQNSDLKENLLSFLHLKYYPQSFERNFPVYHLFKTKYLVYQRQREWDDDVVLSLIVVINLFTYIDTMIVFLSVDRPKPDTWPVSTGRGLNLTPKEFKKRNKEKVWL